MSGGARLRPALPALPWGRGPASVPPALHRPEGGDGGAFRYKASTRRSCLGPEQQLKDAGLR